MNLEVLLIEQLQFAVEVKIVFDDKNYLEQICSSLLGKQITGYNIIENETSYVWNGKTEKKKNYSASTIVSLSNLNMIVAYFNQEISKKWQTPLIQVCPCFVNMDFYGYLKSS